MHDLRNRKVLITGGPDFVGSFIANQLCPLCGSVHGQIIYDLRQEKKPLGVPGLIIRCCDCGMWYKLASGPDHRPNTYGEDYADSSETRHYMENKYTQDFFSQILSRIAITPSDTTKKRPRLLDIGAGMGVMLKVAQNFGFEAEGIEVNSSLAKAAGKAGLNVRRMSIEEIDPEETYDVITMIDIIEHLRSPLDVLKIVYRLLKPDGQAVIYTPNHRAAIVGFAKALHLLGITFPLREIFAGNHLCFFDDCTLPRAINASGLIVRQAHFFPYDPGRPGQSISLISLIGISTIEWFGALFNHAFRMLFYTQKPTWLSGAKTA